MITVVLVIVAAVLVAALVATAATVTRQTERRRPTTATDRVVNQDVVAAWVIRHLPMEVGEMLTHQDVRRIIDWNLEYFRSRTTSGNGHSASVEAPIVVAGAETVDYVLARAGSVGTSYTPAQVHAVLAAQMSYLESVGALGGDHPESG